MEAMFCLLSLRGFEMAGSLSILFGGVLGAKSKVLRAAPMTPPKFDKCLREGVARGEIAFTAKADLDLVCDQYREAFNAAFSETVELNYWGLS